MQKMNWLRGEEPAAQHKSKQNKNTVRATWTKNMQKQHS